MDYLDQIVAIAITAVVIALTFVWFTLLWIKGKTLTTENSSDQEATEPAGAWPIIGHLHLLSGADQLLHHKLGALADKYGPAFNIRLGNQRIFVVSNAEVAKDCFTGANDKILASRPTTIGTKYMCYNDAMFGLGPYGSHWREMRKIVTLQLLSNRSRLETLMRLQACQVDGGIQKLYNLWANSGCHPIPVDLTRWFEDITINVIARMVAGKDLTDDDRRSYHYTIARFFHLLGVFVLSDAFPFLSWLDFQGHEREMKKTAKDFDAILGRWLDEHRRRRVSGQEKNEADQDFIDLMLSIEKDGQFSGSQYDADTCIKSTCLALMAGGGDTTTLTLSWVISLLLNNRLALKKVQNELDIHVGNKRQVDFSDIKNLVYLGAVIKETLRLYPVTPLPRREAREDCLIAGYRVPAGTHLLINTWKIQRDSNIWENPSDFKPERFLTSHVNVDVRGQHSELIPFGFGRRSCPGASFSLEALHLTLARFLHGFDLETPMNQPVDMTEGPGLTTPRATPLEVLLSPRLPAELYALLSNLQH